jgi:hypothetical protein
MVAAEALGACSSSALKHRTTILGNQRSVNVRPYRSCPHMGRGSMTVQVGVGPPCLPNTGIRYLYSEIMDLVYSDTVNIVALPGAMLL